MDNPRPDKVAVVDEVRGRLESSDGAVLTEYRGLTVAELADLRRDLAAAGGDYKVYKNTLVRLAVAGGPQAEIHDLLTGPTAIAFVKGDVSAVAKALRDFARGNPNLVVKGGVVGSGILSASDINVLADLPPRDTLLAQFAGALAAPLQQLAGLVQALPRNLAYGLSALIEQRQAGGEVVEAPAGAPKPEPRHPKRPRRAEPRRAERQLPSLRLRPRPRAAEAEPPAAEAAAGDDRGRLPPRSRAIARPIPRPTTSGPENQQRSTSKQGATNNGRYPDQGPDSGRHLRAVRPRAERAAQGVRGALRRDRGRPGGGGCGRTGAAGAATRAVARTRRPSSTSS